MSTPSDDMPARESDAPVRTEPVPAKTQVTSAPGAAAPAPPKRNRRRPARVAAVEPDPTPLPLPDEPIAETVVAEAEPEEHGPTAWERRRERRAARMAARPVPVPRVERQYRQTVSKVDLWSVTKLALCFYLSAMFVTIVALIALWVIADAAGVVHSVEKFLGDLLSAKNFKFLSGEVLRGTILVGLVVVALQVVITVIAASFYNIFSELFGGLEITIKEEDSSPRNLG